MPDRLDADRAEDDVAAPAVRARHRPADHLAGPPPERPEPSPVGKRDGVGPEPSPVGKRDGVGA